MTFLGSDDFEGDWIPGSPVGTGGQSTLNAILTVSNVARKEVEGLLLPGYQLAPRSTTGAEDVHPVLLMFGDQTDGCTVAGGGTVVTPTGLHYSELILLVPFVQRIGEDGWHSMVVRMYLDNLGAVYAGTAYGYRKRTAALSWMGDRAAVVRLGTDPFEGKFSWGATWHTGADALVNVANFEDLVGMMTTRILGRMHFFNKVLPVCSQFRWDLTHARVATADTSYDMKVPFTGAMSNWPGMSPFENVADGAVVVRGVRWRLGKPWFC